MRLSNGPRSSLIGVHHEPKSLSLFHLASVHIAPPNKPCAAVRLHVPDGRNNHPSDEKHVGSLILGYLTVGDHAIEDLPSMLAPKSTPVRYVRCRHSTPNGLTTINNARSNRSVDEGIVSKHTLTACLPHQD